MTTGNQPQIPPHIALAQAAQSLGQAAHALHQLSLSITPPESESQAQTTAWCTPAAVPPNAPGPGAQTTGWCTP